MDQYRQTILQELNIRTGTDDAGTDLRINVRDGGLISGAGGNGGNGSNGGTGGPKMVLLEIVQLVLIMLEQQK